MMQYHSLPEQLVGALFYQNTMIITVYGCFLTISKRLDGIGMQEMCFKLNFLFYLFSGRPSHNPTIMHAIFTNCKSPMVRSFVLMFEVKTRYI